MGNGSNDVIAEMPDWPARAAFQNSLTPIPIGETIPIPVTTTRARIFLKSFC